MLYDPKWQKQTKADPFTLGSLIAWLEKKPAAKRYDYMCNGHCLLAQYFSESGFDKVHMYGHSFVHGRDIPETMGQAAAMEAGWATPLPARFNDVAGYMPHTFGGALKRAREFAA